MHVPQLPVPAREPVGRLLTRIRTFRVRQPLPGDVRGVLVLMLLNAAAYPFHMNDIQWGSGRWLLEASSILPLLWRRTHPALSSLAAGLATLVVTSNVHPAQPYPYAVLVAAYTIGAELEGGIRRFMVFGFMVGDLVAEFLHGAQDHADDFFVTFLTTITAMLVGALMRTQRAYARVMEERAAELEREHAAAVERAAAAERARIARDMHDVVGHAVALMVVQAEAGPLFLRKDPDKAEAAFDAISAAGRDAMSQLRRLLGVLKHDGADGPGGTATRAPAPTLAMVDDLVAQVRAGGLTVALTSTGTPVPLAADAETAAYRVVQEALTNTMKHAGAARSEVRMEWSEGGLSLTVADDGRGAGRDAGPAGRAASAGGGGGHGLVGLTERLAAVGGTLETPRRDGGGFVLVASIPAARNETVKAG